MSREFDMQRHANCVDLNGGADHAFMGEHCFEMGGAHYCKAKCVTIGTKLIGDATQYVVISMARGGAGLNLPYTPDAARMLGQAMIEAANLADRTNADLANAQLAAALAKKGE